MPIILAALDMGITSDYSALLDSKATAMFIYSEVVKAKGYTTRHLEKPISVYNANNIANLGGYIKKEVDLVMMYKRHKEKATFEVCNLEKQSVIIRHSWLMHHNPEIN